MATPMKPLVQGGGYYPSRVWTPFVRGNGFTTQDGGEEQGVPKTVSGALIHILDALAAPVWALSVAINPVQGGSGTPSPDNVRPISGWTQAKVTRTGKNLLTAAPPWGTSAAMVVDLGKDVSVDSVVIQFKANNTSAASTNAALIDLRESDGTHHYSTLNGYRRADGTYFNQQNTPFSGVFSVRHQNIKFRYVYAWYTGSAYSAFAADTITDWQITIADAVSDYEAPAKQTLTIDLDGTVYGGTLDVTTGVLTVNMAYLSFDGTDIRGLSVGDTGTAGYKLLAIQLNAYGRPKGKVFASSATVTKLVCNQYKTVSSDAVYTRTQGASATRLGTALRFYDESLQTVDAWTTAMSQTPLQVAYEIDAPITVQLTPQEVSTLLGENNIWADVGDVTITYMAQGG